MNEAEKKLVEAFQTLSARLRELSKQEQEDLLVRVALSRKQLELRKGLFSDDVYRELEAGLDYAETEIMDIGTKLEES